MLPVMDHAMTIQHKAPLAGTGTDAGHGGPARSSEQFSLALWHQTALGPGTYHAAHAGLLNSGVALGPDTLGTQRTPRSRDSAQESRGIGPAGW